MVDFWNCVDFSHMLLNEHIREGAVVVDATAGNGQDSLFLAGLVGDKGKVYSFDIQEDAIENTGKRLLKKNLLKRAELVKDDHGKLGKYIKEEEIDGMIFNLGYLPGGNKKIITRKESTLVALKKGLKLLKKGGVIVLVIYTGHPGGREELNGILELTAELRMEEYNVLRYHFINQNNSPQVLAVIKR